MSTKKLTAEFYIAFTGKNKPTEKEIRNSLAEFARRLIRNTIRKYELKYKRIPSSIDLSIFRSRSQRLIFRLSIDVAGEVVTPPKKGPGPGPKKVVFEKKVSNTSTFKKAVAGVKDFARLKS